MIFCARATRGLGRPSLDARSGRSISPIPEEIASGRVERVSKCKTSLVREMPLSIFENNFLILEAHTMIQTIEFKILQLNQTAAF
jgi:hypothetical protein